MNDRPGPSGPPPWAARFWAGHLLVLVLLGVAVMLGTWQWDAWQARRDAEARDLTRTEPIGAITSALGPDDPFPGDRVGQPVILSGTWLDEGTVFVRRDSGYWVVTPLQVGPDRSAVPVVRGVSRTPSAPAVEGAAVLVGWLQPPEGSGEIDPDPNDDVLPQLRVADIVQRVDVDLYGAYVVAVHSADRVAPGAWPVGDDASNAGEDGLAQAELTELPESGRFTAARNLFYAIEWWVFGAFAVFVWVRYLLDERRPSGDGEDDDDDARETGEDDPIASGT